MKFYEFEARGGRIEDVSCNLTNWNTSLPYRLDLSECEQDGSRLNFCKGDCAQCDHCNVVRVAENATTLKKMIIDRLNESCFGRSCDYIVYCHAIPLAAEATPLSNIDLFEEYLISAIKAAKMWDYDDTPEQIARNFCALLLVDPALAEIALGFRLKELNNIF